MGKVKIQRIGGSFAHAYSSTLWKYPKSLEYIVKADRSIAIDETFVANYYWLHESKSIIPAAYSKTKSFLPQLKENYEKIFTHDQELIDLDPEFVKFVPACGYWIEDPISLHRKTKLCSFITSNKTMCEGHRIRLQYLEKYKNKCDVFGRGINPIEKKEMGLNDYYFSFAIENGKYDTYFTEKILDCFATGTIPIYWGTDKISDYFNADGIIKLNDNFSMDMLTPEFHKSKMEAICDNFNRVKDYYTVEDWMVKNNLL